MSCFFLLSKYTGKGLLFKSLEYCLNKTKSVNKMRCQWLYTKTIKKYFSKKFIQKIKTYKRSNQLCKLFI